MSPWTIRRFEGSGDADYETLARLRTLTEPEYPVTAGEIRRHDALRDPKARAQRWLADDPATGETVGSGGYGQGEWNYHPQRFMVGVTVRPDRLNRGVATALYETITAALAPLAPLSLRAHCREDRDPAVDFLTRHGFAETMREWESRLNVAAFDLAPFAGADARVAEEGITIRTLAELKREIGDETTLRKLWELDNACSADAPSTSRSRVSDTTRTCAASCPTRTTGPTRFSLPSRLAPTSGPACRCCFTALPTTIWTRA